MALHELATNSLKYGALSAKAGQVEIAWAFSADGFAMEWCESGGPLVRPPEHTGFGATLIRDVPRHNLNAEVELDYRLEGLRWSLTCDASVLTRSPAEPGLSPSGSPHPV